MPSSLAKRPKLLRRRASPRVGMQWNLKFPLCSGIGDAESGTLGIALGTAAGVGSHNGDPAAGRNGEAEAFFEQRALRTAATGVRDGAGSGEQC